MYALSVTQLPKVMKMVLNIDISQGIVSNVGIPGS